MKKLFPVLLALIAVTAGGCAPKVDVEADVAAIRSLNDQVVAASNAGDVAGWLAFFTDDAVMMAPNAPAVVGKEAIRTWAQGVFDQFTFEETVTAEEIQVAGDWGFTRVTYTAKVTPKAGGEPQEETGKGIYIVHRQPDGSWKYTHCIWNSNQPAAAATE